MMHGAYLVALLISLLGMYVLDKRYRLVYFDSKQRALRVLIGGVAFFVIWDVAGIVLDIFYTGKQTFLTGLTIGTNFPIEELAFLTLLMYCSALVYRLLRRYL